MFRAVSNAPGRRPSKPEPTAPAAPVGSWLDRLRADAATPLLSGPQARRAMLIAYIEIALFMFAVDTVDIFTILHDVTRVGRSLAAWQPTVWEYTSGAGILAAAWLSWLALRIAPPESGRWLRVIAVHLLAATAFSVLHLAVMIGLRIAIYAGLGLSYVWAPGDFPYEYRKDLLSYILTAGCFWVTPRLLRPLTAATAAREGATFDILDGGRTLRTPVADIVAVQSAGNYVEFRLADGAVRLMRATLAEVEQALAPHGFVRIHRSWIANAHRLRLLEPAGSGDYRLVLDGGVEAPVSRRYPAALARLKGVASPDEAPGA